MEIRVDDPKLAKIPPDRLMAMLKEKDGNRILTITLNNTSYHLLAWELFDTEGRPEILRFIPQCLLALKASIEKVVIYDLVNNFYLSYVTIRDDKEDRTYNIELHVTDAITLAVSAKCPLFVTEETFDKYKIETDKSQEQISKEQMEKMFESIDPKNLKQH